MEERRHMDLSRFAELFIRKERRQRLLYELTRPEKRAAGLERFCHGAEGLLEPKKILMKGEDLERRPEFRRFLERHREKCLVLCADRGPEGSLLSPEDAVRQAILCFDAVLILGNGFAVVFGEVMKGGRGKYLLAESPEGKPGRAEP